MKDFCKNHRLIILGAICILAVLTAGIIFSAERKTTAIAFYQIPENTQKQIENELALLTDQKLKFHTIDPAKPLTEKDAHRHHIIFTYNSRTAINVAPENVPDTAIKNLPTQIQLSVYNQNTYYALPVLLDHYEIALYSTYRNQLNLSEPSSFDQFKEYLKAVKEAADFPLVAIGSDDNELMGFVSAMVQSTYGANEYFDICVEFNKAQSRGEDIPYRIRVVLDEIKELENEGLLHKNWLNANLNDIIFLMQQHQLGCFATYLSTQRQVPYVLIKYYDSYLFPQHDSPASGVIAPELCALKMKDSKTVDNIFEKLVSNKVQTSLSKQTMLAPAAAIAESNDVQSDNVRYWCSASRGGPIPDLQNASFISYSHLHDYAERIRAYLK